MPESPNNDLYLSSKHLRRKMKDVAQQKDADRETIDGPHNGDALEITIAAAEHREYQLNFTTTLRGCSQTLIIPKLPMRKHVGLVTTLN